MYVRLHRVCIPMRLFDIIVAAFTGCSDTVYKIKHTHNKGFELHIQASGSGEYTYVYSSHTHSWELY